MMNVAFYLTAASGTRVLGVDGWTKRFDRAIFFKTWQDAFDAKVANTKPGSHYPRGVEIQGVNYA